MIGYDVPSQNLISYDKSTDIYTLNVSFGIPFREPVIDKFTVNVALPEGSEYIDMDCEYTITTDPISRRYTNKKKKNLKFEEIFRFGCFFFNFFLYIFRYKRNRWG